MVIESANLGNIVRNPLGPLLADELLPFVTESSVSLEDNKMDKFCGDSANGWDLVLYGDINEQEIACTLSKMLYNAMRKNDPQKIRIALEAGADVNNIDLKNDATSDREYLVRIAIELGFKVNKLIGNGKNGGNICTLLHIAAMKEEADMIVFLLERNADTNIPDSNGLIPLHYVIHQGHQPTLELLLSYSTNKIHMPLTTLLDLAIKMDRRNIIDCIVRQIALIESQGPFVDTDTYALIDQHLYIRDYFNVCKLELERFQESFVEGLFSYHDFFIDEELKRLARDELVIDNFTRCDLEEMFPNFGKIIIERFERQKRWVELEDRIADALSQLLGFDLQKRRKIYRRMMNYLGLEDLYNLSSV
ncbi:hypothetical protein QAD02_023951 [Eretmocerus hayati]|uniref:Uncharacterized protein n=1 Tax=Eretmocerus hayati TaxID=131215 RepID=A0ACC2PYY6_9HYME|nr:hypothetical protein QAD02_023951 [Eretmocerus hayati]